MKKSEERELTLRRELQSASRKLDDSNVMVVNLEDKLQATKQSSEESEKRQHANIDKLKVDVCTHIEFI